jgi:GT2 family glycosyltransferase
VLPTYRRPERLARCLRSLAGVAPPSGGFEALVVDDGGGLPLADALAGVSARLEVRLLEGTHHGPAAARNAGAAAARGALLAFTDDDCLVDPGWLRAYEGPLTTDPGLLLGGRTLNGCPHNVWSSASQLLVDYLYGYYNAEPGRARFFASNNIAIGRRRFHEIGGFDAAFTRAAGEDRDLCDRQLQSGGRLLSVPEALVTHRHELTGAGFLRQHFDYGRGARLFRDLRAARRGERVRIEPPRFYLGLLRYPFGRAHGRRAAWLVALLVLAQATNAAGFLRGAPRSPEPGASP